MPGIRSLRRIQLAKEATAGTQVNATTIWRGEGTLKDDTNVVHPVEDIGIVLPTDRVYVPFVGGTLALSETPATFEQLPYLCEMGIKGVASGVADGGGSGFVYTYTLPQTTKNTINNYSVEAGDDQQMERTGYAYCESFKVSGKINAAIMMSAVIKTRQVANNPYTAATIASTSTTSLSDSANGFGFLPTGGGRFIISGTTVSAINTQQYYSYTAGTTATITGIAPAFSTTFTVGSTITLEQWFSTASIPAVEECLFQKSKLYIDPSTGSWGGTQKTNTFLDFELDYKTGWKGQPTGDGRLDFSFAKSTQPSGTLKLTFEHEGSATAEKTAWRNKTARLVRILVQGSALSVAGSYSVKTLIIDVVGRWKDFSTLKDDKGNDTVTGEMEIGYDTSASSAGQILVVNTLSALP